MMALAVMACSSPVEAHAMLDHASPAVGSTVGSLARTGHALFHASARTKVQRGRSAQCLRRACRQGKSISGNVMRLSVGSLPPGRYSVTWHVLSVDTHTTQGSFSFHVGR